MLRLLVVDDHEIVRAGLVSTLGANPRFRVVGSAGTGAEALKLATRVNADVALVDLRLPDIQGTDLCRRLIAAVPCIRVVVLSTYLSEETVRAALEAGASGYVTKAAGLTKLRDTIASVVDQPSGDLHAPAIVNELHRLVAKRVGQARPTPQQERVLELAAQGLTNRQVGERLFISESTVRFHLQRLKESLGAKTRTELIAKAIRTGVIASAPEDLNRVDGPGRAAGARRPMA
jgi:DNA-binding NarL/FixJ family response regulator